MAGYSNTPLVKKLGIRSGGRVLSAGEPANFAATPGPCIAPSARRYCNGRPAHRHPRPGDEHPE
jgi:hypothetical protein